MIIMADWLAAASIGPDRRQAMPRPKPMQATIMASVPCDPASLVSGRLVLYPTRTHRAELTQALITTITVTVSWHPRPLALPPDR